MARGHLTKRGATWYAVVEYPRDPETNKRNQQWVRLPGVVARREAEREMTRILREVDTGSGLEPSRLTLAEFLEHWLAGEAASRVRATTLEAYRRYTRLHIVPFLGSRKIQQLRPTDVAALFRTLVDHPATAQHCRTVLSGAMRSAVLWGWVPTNPVRDVTPPTYHTKRGGAWSREEVAAFLLATEGRRMWTLYCVVLASGLRMGELQDLRWADVDLADEAIVVRHTASWTKGQYHRSTPKNGRERVVTLDRETIACLKRHRARQAEERLKAGEAWLDEDRVFPTPEGKVYRRSTLSRAFLKDMATAGARAIRFHDLRHTHATLLLEAGVPIKTVSVRLGHAGIGITADTYAHVTAGMERHAADVWGNLRAG